MTGFNDRMAEFLTAHKFRNINGSACLDVPGVDIWIECERAYEYTIVLSRGICDNNEIVRRIDGTEAAISALRGLFIFFGV